MRLNLEKFIDKLEPSDSLSAVGFKKNYGSVVNETIHEEEFSEHDSDKEKRDKFSSGGSYLSSQESGRRQRGYSMLDGPVNPLSLNFVRQKTHRIARSAIDFLEYDSIPEELEEYEFQNNQEYDFMYQQQN